MVSHLSWDVPGFGCSPQASGRTNFMPLILWADLSWSATAGGLICAVLRTLCSCSRMSLFHLKTCSPVSQARKKSTKINFLGPETARWGGGSLESLSSLGFEERNLGCPGKFAGMSRTCGGVHEVCAKKSSCAFSFSSEGNPLKHGFNFAFREFCAAKSAHEISSS